MPFLIAAGIGAGASLLGSGLNFLSSNKAADVQKQAATTASNNALAQVQQTRTDLSPFRNTGAGANALLGSFFGLGQNSSGVPSGTVGDYLAGAGSMSLPNGFKLVNQGGTLNILDPAGHMHWDNVPAGAPVGDIFHSVAPEMEPVAPSQGGTQGGDGGGKSSLDNEQKYLEKTPGYQFALSQGLKSVQNSAAARGLGTSGAALKGAATFATGLADQTYQQNLLNPLMTLSNLGENAAATTGSLGQAGVSNANALQVGGANAQAGGIVGGANAIAGGLNNAGSQALNYQLYSKLLGGGGGGGGSGGGFYDNTSTWTGS